MIINNPSVRGSSLLSDFYGREPLSAPKEMLLNRKPYLSRERAAEYESDATREAYAPSISGILKKISDAFSLSAIIGRKRVGSIAPQYTAYVCGKQVDADLVVSSKIKDRNGDPVILNREALLRFEKAVDEYRGIVVTSSFRRHDEQVKLYKNYLESKNPYPAARPGYSKHQSGFALDISVKNGDQDRIHDAMTRAGFIKPLPVTDPVHWEYVGFSEFRDELVEKTICN